MLKFLRGWLIPNLDAQVEAKLKDLDAQVEAKLKDLDTQVEATRQNTKATQQVVKFASSDLIQLAEKLDALCAAIGLELVLVEGALVGQPIPETLVVPIQLTVVDPTVEQVQKRVAQLEVLFRRSEESIQRIQKTIGLRGNP